MMNHGVSENLKSSMKLKLNALSSIQNVSIREHHSNSVVNHLISEETLFLLPLDPLKFLLKEELLFSTKLTSVERKLFTLKTNLALMHLNSPSSKSKLKDRKSVV